MRNTSGADAVKQASSRSRLTKALLIATVVSAIPLIRYGIVGRCANAQPQAPSFELLEASIPQLQAALATGIVNSRDLVAMYLRRIEAYDQRGPALNAISVINPNALAEAATLDAEREAGTTRGPLHGIPIIIKDNYDTIGLQTAGGSRALAGWNPPDDATLVQKLHAAGAILIAKSNMHEFAYGITTVGSLFGETRNPYALDATLVDPAAALVLPSPPILLRLVWAATPAARSEFRHRTIALLAYGVLRAWRAGPASSRFPAPRTLAGRSGAA
ncbi:MAG: amidase [Acetobacteraceae bacterium]|nr:amidase [Acetobacteraceae bacterium]